MLEGDAVMGILLLLGLWVPASLGVHGQLSYAPSVLPGFLLVGLFGIFVLAIWLSLA